MEGEAVPVEHHGPARLPPPGPSLDCMHGGVRTLAADDAIAATRHWLSHPRRPRALLNPTPKTTKQIGAAIAIGAITAVRLAGVTNVQGAISNLTGTAVSPNQTCLLGFEPANLAPCRFAFVTAIVGVGVPLLLGILQLVTCDMCGCGDILDFIVGLLLSAWWIASSLALSSLAFRGNQKKIPQQEWRMAVIGLCWASAGLALVAFAMHSGRVCARCCCGKRNKGKRGADDVEGGAKAGLFGGASGAQRQRSSSAAVELGREVRGRPYLQQQGLGASFAQQPGNAAGGANALRTGLNQPSF